MEINKININSSNDIKKDKQPLAKTDEKQQATVTNTEKVSLTPEAKKLSQLENSLSSSVPIDSEKIANLKRAILDGSYQINAESLAEKISTSEQSFD